MTAPPAAPPRPPRAARAPRPAGPHGGSGRTAVTLVFAVNGFVFASWVSRVPQVKAQVHTGTAALGLALLGVAAGSMLTMPAAGRWCARRGSALVTVAAGFAVCAALTLPALARSPLVLGLALAVLGFGYGAMDVAMNTDAVAVVRRLGRPVMPSFHAAWSLAGVAGAGLGGLAAAAGLSPERHLLLVAAAAATVLAGTAPTLLRHDDGPDPAATAGAGAPAPTRRGALVGGGLAALAAVAFASAYGEGAVADWAALHLHADLHAVPSLAAAGYAAFALAMTVGRLTGAAVIARWGPAATLRAAGLLAAVGMAVTVSVPVLPVAVAGLAVTGLGLAVCFPLALQGAGDRAGSRGIATVSTVGYAGLLLGPPVIGAVASVVGLPVALGSVVLFAAAIAALAARTGPGRPGNAATVVTSDTNGT